MIIWKRRVGGSRRRGLEHFVRQHRWWGNWRQRWMRRRMRRRSKRIRRVRMRRRSKRIRRGRMRSRRQWRHNWIIRGVGGGHDNGWFGVVVVVVVFDTAVVFDSVNKELLFLLLFHFVVFVVAFCFIVVVLIFWGDVGEYNLRHCIALGEVNGQHDIYVKIKPTETRYGWNVEPILTISKLYGPRMVKSWALVVRYGWNVGPFLTIS